MAYDDDLDEDRDFVPRTRTIELSYQATLDTRRFLGLVANGIGPYNAGAEVGWSPRIVREKLADPEMQEMIADAEQCTTEDIETAMIRRAKRGNVQAAAIYLFNRAPDRWKPPQNRVAVTSVGRIEINVVEAAKQAAIDLFALHDPRLLQIGGPLDAIDATAQ